MAIKVYKGGSWVNATGVSAIGKADRLAIGQTNTSLPEADKKYYLSFVDVNHPYNARQYEDFYTGIGITYSPISKSLGVGGVLYLSGQENNFQGSIRSYGGADKLFVIYNESAEGVIAINPANSAGLNNVGIATFKRGAAAADDDSYFRSNVSPPKDCSGIYNLGKPEEKWNNVYANCFIGNGSGLDGTGEWKEDTYKNLKAGTEAGQSITAETCYNIFAGFKSGCLTTGAGGAGGSDQIADGNVFLGTYTGRCNTTGAYNFYGGYFAGRGKDPSSTGDANVFIGRSAGQEINTGSNNTFLGKYAGLGIDSGDNNILLGPLAGRHLSSASQVIALGVRAGFCNISGNSGVFLGTYAGRNVTSGAGNVAMGMNALRGEDGVNITGGFNVALGYAAGRTLGPVGEVLGQGNVFLGATAAENQTAGDFNVAIGYGVCLANTTSGGQLAIGVADKTWMSGDSCFNIKPGRGIIDCAGSCGTSGQVLTSQQVAGTGGNPNDYYVKWDSNVSTATKADKIKITDDIEADEDPKIHYIHFGEKTSDYDDVKVDSNGLSYYQARDDEKWVGIGTTSPHDSTGNASGLALSRADGQVRLVMKNNDTGHDDGDGSHIVIGSKDFTFENRTSEGHLYWSTNIAATGAAADIGKRMTLTPEGHVGIGTTNPIADDPNTGKTIKDYLEDNNSVLAVGVVTARDYYGTFKGTISPDASITLDKIEEGSTSAEVVDISTDGFPFGHFKVLTEGTERLRITGIGSVGIGTTNPISPLHIKTLGNGTASGGTNPLITLHSGSPPRNNWIGIKDADNLVIAADDDNQGNDSTIRFWIDSNERLRIGTYGQIGLGKDVDGTLTNDFGTNDQVLTSKGPDAAAVWQDLGGIPASVANQLKITKTASKTELYLLGVENGVGEDTAEGNITTKTVYQKTQNTLFFDTSNDTLRVPKIRGQLIAGSGDWPAIQGNLTIQTNHLIPSSNATINSQGIVIDPLEITNVGSGYGNGYVTNIPTSGGTGTNLTVNTTTGGGVLLNIAVNSGGTGYVVGDTVSVNLNGNTSATFKITAVNTEVTGGQNLGSETKKWANVYAQKFVGALGGTADSTDQIKVQKNEDAGNIHYFGMVNGAGEKGFPINKTVYTDTSLYYVPSTDILTASNITVTTKLHVTGNTELGDSATEDTIIFTGKVNSSVLPKTNAPDSDPLTTGYDLGGSNNYWRTIYAREFKGSVVGDATSAKTLNIGTDNTAADRYLTFVADSGDGKNVYMDSELKYNPNTDTLTPVNLSVTGDTTLGNELTGEDPDTTTFNSHVISHILPGGTLTDDASQYNLGESTRKWNTVYANEFSGSFTGSIEKIKTTKSEDQAKTYLTFTTTTPATTGNLDSFLLTNPHLYFRSNSTSPGEKLTVDCQLDVSGDASFAENVTFGNSGTTDDIVTFNSKVASHVFPSHSATADNDTSGKDLGDSNNYWRKVYARDYAGTFTGTLTSRNIAMTGDIAWNVDFDASGDVTADGTIQPAAVDESMLNITNAPSADNVGYFLKLVDATGTLTWSQVSAGDGVSLKFIELTDTPTAYASGAGDKDKLVAVNSAGNALIFTDASNVGTDTFVTGASFVSITGGKQLQLTRNNNQSQLTANLTLSDLGGVNKFLDLTDVTPTTYDGQAHKFVRVNKPNTGNDNGSGLEFIDATGFNSDFSFIGLSDTPTEYAGSAADKDKYVRVNSAGNGLVFDSATISAGTVDLGKTGDTDHDNWHFIFADSRDGGSETLYVNNDANPALIYKDSTSTLQTVNLSVAGSTTLGDATVETDTVTWNARSGTILPSGTSGTQDLGSSTYKWGTVYANTIAGTLSVSTGATQVLYTGEDSSSNPIVAGTGNFTFVETNTRSTLLLTNGNSSGSGGVVKVSSKSDANYVEMHCDGGIEICRSIKDTGLGGGAYLDFKDATGDDYDARIQLATNVADAGWNVNNDKGGLIFETGGANRRHMLLTKDGVLGITTGTDANAIKANNGTNSWKTGFVPGIPRDSNLNDAHNINNTVVLDVNGTIMLRANNPFPNTQSNSRREGGQIVFNNSEDTVGFSVDVYGTTANNSSLRIIDEKEPQDNRGTQRFAMNRGGAITFKPYSGADTGRSNADADYGVSGYVLTSKGVDASPLWEPAPAGASALKTKVRYHQGGFTIYTPTTGTKFIRVQVIGPGGGGGGLDADSDDDTLSGSGGGGGYCESYITIAGNSNLGTMVYQSATGGTGGTTGGSDGATASISMFWTSYGTANQICMKACGGQGGEGSHNANTNQLSGNGGEALYEKGTTATGGVISVYDSANPPSGGELPTGLDFIYLSKGEQGVNNYTTKKRYPGPPSGIGYQSWDIDGGGSNGMGGYTYGYGGHGCFDNESYNRVGGNGTDGIVIVTEFGDF